MPSFAFKGFENGSQVSLSALQAGTTASGSVVTWGQGSLGSLSIVERSSSRTIAPAGIWLEAIEIAGFDVQGGPGPGEYYDPSFHEITYVWTVRNNPLPALTAPLNIPDPWKNPNVAYGREVFLGFPEAGTFDIDLFAIDQSGTTATATYQVVIADADGPYSGPETICYSQSGNFAGAPIGATQVSSYAQLASTAGALGSLEARILLRRGESFADFVPLSNPGTNFAYGDFGAGERPVVLLNGNAQFRPMNGRDFKLYNLDIRGEWESAGEHGVLHEPIDIVNSADIFALYSGCRFDGYSILRAPLNDNWTLGFYDCELTNWQSCGLFVNYNTNDNVRLGLRGTVVAQHVDALNGNDNKIGNNLGPSRIEAAKHGYIGMCDFFSRNGWSSNGGIGGTADQPCLRLNTGASSTLIDSFWNLDRVVCEGGGTILTLDGQNNGTTENPGNYLLDKVLLCGTTDTGGYGKFAFGGTTVRNLYAFQPEVPVDHYGVSSMVSYKMDQPTSANRDSDVAMYNSTFVSLQTSDNNKEYNNSAKNIAVYSHDGSFNNFTIENNLSHMPAQDAPDTADQPVDTATPLSGFNPRYNGLRYNFLPLKTNLSSSVGNGSSFNVAYSAFADENDTPTNQAYWLSRDAEDTSHMLYMGSTRHFAARGDFSISFSNSSHMTITNTSGSTWSGGSSYRLRPDRTSLLPPTDQSFASPSTIPLPRPQPGSNAIGSGDLGRQAYDDFFGNPRPQQGSRGAFEPT